MLGWDCGFRPPHPAAEACREHATHRALPVHHACVGVQDGDDRGLMADRGDGEEGRGFNFVKFKDEIKYF